MWLHYLVNNNVCQTVHNHSDTIIKRHDKLTVTRTNKSQQMFKVYAFGFDTRTKMISPLINCLINNAVLYSRPCFNPFFRHLSWMSFCMMGPTFNFPDDLTGSLCVPDAPSWLSTKSLTASMFSCSSMWCARFATTQLSICFAGSSQF